jgi:hypothetical protein
MKSNLLLQMMGMVGAHMQPPSGRQYQKSGKEIRVNIQLEDNYLHGKLDLQLRHMSRKSWLLLTKWWFGNSKSA